MQTQTEEKLNKEAITQTTILEFNEEDCQTDPVESYEFGAQVQFKSQVQDVGTDPDTDLIEKEKKKFE